MKRPRSVSIFTILLGYILIQLTWWSYLIFSLNVEISELKIELAKHTISNEVERAKEVSQLIEGVNKKKYMILGEGSVFICLLGLGAYQTLKTIRKEQHLAKQQNNFMLSVTHELKTPLASARLQLETLNRHELNRDKQKALIQNALNDADRLNYLIENILMASKLEQTGLNIKKEPLKLADTINELINQNTVFKNQQHRIMVSVNSEVVNADKFYFDLLLSNLIDNAIKYAPEGNITIKSEQKNNKFSLSIIDEGKGISLNELDRIFEKFYRIGNEETRNQKGTGLGLYIVKQICNKLNWEIEAKSNMPVGTQFILNIT